MQRDLVVHPHNWTVSSRMLMFRLFNSTGSVMAVYDKIRTCSFDAFLADNNWTGKSWAAWGSMCRILDLNGDSLYSSSFKQSAYPNRHSRLLGYADCLKQEDIECILQIQEWVYLPHTKEHQGSGCPECLTSQLFVLVPSFCFMRATMSNLEIICWLIHSPEYLRMFAAHAINTGQHIFSHVDGFKHLIIHNTVHQVSPTDSSVPLIFLLSDFYWQYHHNYGSTTNRTFHLNHHRDCLKSSAIRVDPFNGRYLITDQNQFYEWSGY